jgi:hypothetical protein
MVYGLLMELDDHNCQPVAEAAGHRGPHRLQHLLSRAVWDDQHLADIASAWAAGHLDDGDALIGRALNLPGACAADEEHRELAGVPEEVLFATAAEWVARHADAHHAGRLHDELRKLGRYPLLVIDEVGYIPFEPEAANLFFQLVSARYERASLIVTSNKPFGRWGEVFGDDVVAAAMIDRLVHHAEVISLKGDSYRLKDMARRLGANYWRAQGQAELGS